LLPCLDAGRLLGLLAGREAGLDAGLLDGRLPPIKHYTIYNKQLINDNYDKLSSFILHK